jgi:putative intracellular protease/amidase
MIRTLVPLASRFEPVEAIVAIDFLRRRGFEVMLVVIGATDLFVTGGHNVTVTTDVVFDIILAGQTAIGHPTANAKGDCCQ